MSALRQELLSSILAVIATAAACAESPALSKEITITWLGHAAFEIVSPGGTDILVDPFLTKNPATPAEFKDLSRCTTEPCPVHQRKQTCAR